MRRERELDKLRANSFPLLAALILLIVSLTPLSGFPSEARFLWLRGAGGADRTQPSAIAPLHDGSAFLTGTFTAMAVFGRGEPNQTSFTASGEYDAFLVKYHPDGTLAWAQNIQGPARDYPYDVAVLLDGSVLVTGMYCRSSVFAPGAPEETTLTSAGNEDMFLAKYHSDGKLAWVRSAGGPHEDYGIAIAPLPDGAWFLTGGFNNRMVFASGQSDEITLTSRSKKSMFLAKYNPDGRLAWARIAADTRIRGTAGITTVQDSPRPWPVHHGYHGVNPRSMAPLPDGGVVLAGGYCGPLLLEPDQAAPETLAGIGGNDIFLARYSPDGTLVWITTVGGPHDDRGPSVAVSPDSTILLCGTFEDTAVFGSGEATEVTLSSAGGSDVFVAKYNLDGSLRWAKSAGGSERENSGQDCARAIAALPDGSAVVTGDYWEGATFGRGEPNETVFNFAHKSYSGSHGFLARYSPDGTLDWAKSPGAPNVCMGDALAVSPGGILLAGTFYSDATFGPASETSRTTLSSAGRLNAFLVSYAVPSTPHTAPPPTAAAYSPPPVAYQRRDGHPPAADSTLADRAPLPTKPASGPKPALQRTTPLNEPGRTNTQPESPSSLVRHIPPAATKTPLPPDDSVVRTIPPLAPSQTIDVTVPHVSALPDEPHSSSAPAQAPDLLPPSVAITRVELLRGGKFLELEPEDDGVYYFRNIDSETGQGTLIQVSYTTKDPPFPDGDPGSGVVQKTYFLNDEPYEHPELDDQSVTLNLYQLAGDNTFAIEAADAAGNIGFDFIQFSVTLIASMIIKPESLHPNPGIITAYVRFPQGYHVGDIDGIDRESGPYCDGALAQTMMLSHDRSVMVIKFRRTDVVTALAALDPPQQLDTCFTVIGTFAYGTAFFEATDNISNILRH